MIVIKIGGSLTDTPLLQEWLRCAGEIRNAKTIIVPGGGKFAYQVRLAQRQWRFSDNIAHTMAVLAMQQMAWQFKGIHRKLEIASTADEIEHVLQNRNAVIWSPSIRWLERSAIAASWDVTSDSLAAWLATELEADQLILVKSANIPEQLSPRQLCETDIVDKAFNRFIAQAKFKIKLYNRCDIASFKATYIQ